MGVTRPFATRMKEFHPVSPGASSLARSTSGGSLPWRGVSRCRGPRGTWDVTVAKAYCTGALGSTGLSHSLRFLRNQCCAPPEPPGPASRQPMMTTRRSMPVSARLVLLLDDPGAICACCRRSPKPWDGRSQKAANTRHCPPRPSSPPAHSAGSDVMPGSRVAHCLLSCRRLGASRHGWACGPCRSPDPAALDGGTKNCLPEECGGS